MSWTIMKFGGSSLASPEKVTRAAALVTRHEGAVAFHIRDRNALLVVRQFGQGLGFVGRPGTVEGVGVQPVAVLGNDINSVIGPFGVGALDDGEMQGIAADAPAHFAGIAGLADFIAHLDLGAEGQGRHFAQMGILGIGPETQTGLSGRVAEHDLNALAVSVIHEFSNHGAGGDGPDRRASWLGNIDPLMHGRPGTFVGIVDGPLFAVDFRAFGSTDEGGHQTGFHRTPRLLHLDGSPHPALCGLAHHHADIFRYLTGRHIAFKTCALGAGLGRLFDFFGGAVVPPTVTPAAPGPSTPLAAAVIELGNLHVP